jgi:hypothetical protein
MQKRTSARFFFVVLKQELPSCAEEEAQGVTAKGKARHTEKYKQLTGNHGKYGDEIAQAVGKQEAQVTHYCGFNLDSDEMVTEVMLNVGIKA